MAEENLWKEYMAERVKQILEEMDSGERDRSGRLQEDILKGMAPEYRKQMEHFADSLALQQAGEQLEIYEKAFLDGLRLGHQAF